MTAAIIDIKNTRLGTDDSYEPLLLALPVEANTMIFGGTMVAQDAAGFAVPASSNAAFKILGRCQRQINNLTLNIPYGAQGAQTVQIEQGCFDYANSVGADLISQANYLTYCYAVDDNTVSLTDGGGTRPVAGVILNVASNGRVYVLLSGSSPYAVNPEIQLIASQYIARNVGPGANVAVLASYTVAGNDGVTNVQGDVVFLYAQTTKSQNGPYVVGVVAVGLAPLTRPDWYVTGSAFASGQLFKLGGEGTVFKACEFKITNAAGVVDTADPGVYPGRITQQVSLGAGAPTGTVTISNVPILSATKTQVVSARITPFTPSLTVSYNPSPMTQGAIGTGSVVFQAQLAAGTINTADGSLMNVTVINF